MEETIATLLPIVAAARATCAADPPNTGLVGIPLKESSSMDNLPATTRSKVTGKRTSLFGILALPIVNQNSLKRSFRFSDQPKKADKKLNNLKFLKSLRL